MNHMAKIDYFKKSIVLHKKLGGKIEMKNKVDIKNLTDLSLCYTPGVGAVSSAIAKNKQLARELTMKKNSVAVVSDGSAVLGLGNIGPEAAMPVMEGKAMLFKKFAGIDAVPIVLDTQDTEEIIRTVKILAPNFGGINLEDISAPRCFEIEERLKKELDIPVMHDDQHGTAIVVLAALINALKVAKKDIKKIKIVVSGAGAAGVAITKILLNYGAEHIVVLDSAGTIHFDRPNLNGSKKQLAQLTNLGCSGKAGFKCETGDLSETIKDADVFIGVSAPGILTADMVRTMAERSIVFAMSNPMPEIMPDIAKKSGAFIVATGRSDFSNQINNVLAFPGIFRGALDGGKKMITDDMKMRAADNLAKIIKKPTAENIIPSAFNKDVVKAVAKAVKSR